MDGPHFTDRYLTELKSKGLKLLVLDDSGMNKYVAADFVLNPNSDANESMYPHRGPETKLLLGTKYALLRREFAAWRAWKRQTAAKVRRILITMGGSDPDDITDLTLQALGMLKNKDIEHTVVSGGSNPRLQNLQRRAMSISDRIRVLPTVADIPRLMAESDLAIIAAGGTLWELMYMSCPIVSFGRVPAQRRILEQLDARGIVLNMGCPRDVQPHILAQAVDELSISQSRRGRMALLGREQVDGEGAERVCRILANSNEGRP